MGITGAIAGVIFGLFFAGMGGYIAFQTSVPTYLNWIEAQQWQATDGRILQAGGEVNGVTASYSYRVGQREYRGNRVYLAEFKDNIGAYHREMRSYLREMARSAQPVTVWFNPENPAESIIDRDMRWGLFALTAAFCSVFIIVGLTVAVAAIKSSSKPRLNRRPSLASLRQSWQAAQASGEFNDGFFDYLRYKQQQAATHPGDSKYSDPDLQPWLQNPGWKTGRIRSNAKRGMLTMWGFALLWNAISSPVLFALGDEWQRGNHAIVIGLLFPLVGFFLLRKAWMMTREWRRFGVIELEMDPFPGAINGHVGGRLRINGIYQSDYRYQLELACVYSYVSRSGKNNSRNENILWSEKGTALATPTSSAAGSGTLLSFRFNVPDNLPESAVKQSDDYHLWRLSLSAEIPGVDLERDYTIPVFRTEQRSSSVRHDLSRQAAENHSRAVEHSTMALSSGQFDQTALARSLRYNDQGGVARFYYPMLRHKTLTLFSLLFAGGFGFASFSIISEFGGGGGFGIIALLFSLPFALVGFLAALLSIYLPLSNLRVEIGNGTLKVTHRLFIVPIRRFLLPVYDITRLETKRSGSTTLGKNTVVQFSIQAHTRDGKKITIAEDIDGETLATAFKNYLEKRLGISRIKSRDR